VRFLDRADFVLAHDSERVTCAPTGTVPEQTVDFLYANQIVPLLQHRAGKLVLHGSAVACSGRAIAFVGQSGRGKSTLAAAFARAGYPFLTDDGVLVERDGAGYLMAPNSPVLRLWRDSDLAVLGRRDTPALAEEDEKRRIEASPHVPYHGQPLGLQAIYLLGEGDAELVAIDPMVPPSAFDALMRHAFILDIEDRARMRLQWDQIGDLAESVPCYALDFPRRFDSLPGVIEAILGHARIGVSGP
jgi:hypothetical protein